MDFGQYIAPTFFRSTTDGSFYIRHLCKVIVISLYHFKIPIFSAAYRWKVCIFLSRSCKTKATDSMLQTFLLWSMTRWYQSSYISRIIAVINHHHIDPSKNFIGDELQTRLPKCTRVSLSIKIYFHLFNFNCLTILILKSSQTVWQWTYIYIFSGTSPPWAKSSSCKGQKKAQRSNLDQIFVLSFTELKKINNKNAQGCLALLKEPSVPPTGC